MPRKQTEKEKIRAFEYQRILALHLAMDALNSPSNEKKDDCLRSIIKSIGFDIHGYFLDQDDIDPNLVASEKAWDEYCFINGYWDEEWECPNISILLSN